MSMFPNAREIFASASRRTEHEWPGGAAPQQRADSFVPSHRQAPFEAPQLQVL